MNQKLAFDDVTLVHQFTTLQSRKDVDTTSQIGDIILNCPVISANMSTVTGLELADQMYKNGGIGSLHRFFDIQANVDIYKQLKERGSEAFVSVGLGDKEYTRAKALYHAGARYFILDVANGASSAVADMGGILKRDLSGIYLIVGNFGSLPAVEGYLKYCKNKGLGTPDGLKLGVGPGRNCITAKETGVGYPMFSLIQEVRMRIQNEYSQAYSDIHLISDGGVRTPGDVVKALVAGADFVMMGGEFSGCYEAAGANTMIDGKLHKKHYGSASKEAYDEQGKNQDYITAEGVSFYVPVDKSCKDVIQRYMGGLRSAMTYLNTECLQDLRCADFIQITSAGEIQNQAHGLKK